MNPHSTRHLTKITIALVQPRQILTAANSPNAAINPSHASQTDGGGKKVDTQRGLLMLFSRLSNDDLGSTTLCAFQSRHCMWYIDRPQVAG